MPFHARNAYYLRISEKDVLPLYLYLDERHLEWMSDIILQHVVSDLRPKILEKLRAESDMKSSSGNANVRGTIETHRGENYQFCYFLRKTEPHSVVIKRRMFKTVPVRIKAGVLNPPVTPGSANEPKRRKRKAPSHPEAENEDVDMDRNKRRRPQLRNRVSTVQKVAEAMDVDDVNPQAQDDDYQPSSSSSDDLIPTNKFKKKGITRKTSNRRHESDEGESVVEDAQPPMDLTVEEEKPKPVLDVKYRGFNLFGRCLCVVVEPWPHFQYTMTGRQTSLAPIFQRSSLTPAPNLSGEGIAGPSKSGARAPLFLPDDDDDDPSVPTSREPQPHPLFGGMVSFDDDDENDDGGMMAFSQVLNNTGDYRSGAADDDDGVEEVFFGDADEHREI